MSHVFLALDDSDIQILKTYVSNLLISTQYVFELSLFRVKVLIPPA